MIMYYLCSQIGVAYQFTNLLAPDATLKCYFRNCKGSFFSLMISEIFNDYKELGLKVIPIVWNIQTKQPVSHHNWAENKVWKLYPNHNALMVQTGNGWGSLDFDIKNTKDKELFNKWLQIVTNTQPEILEKCFIEKTKSDGYHVWIKYSNLPKKTALADSDTGAEVIAIYSNGPLVYTYPTPGYSEFFQSMLDVQELNEIEYNYLIEISQYFNEYKPTYDPSKKAISYPKGYEAELSQYDNSLSDESWEIILQDIGLEPLQNFKYNKKDKFAAYRRKQSTSNAISAKVYFKTKRLMLFTASLHQFPNWHNKQDYPTWALPPSFVLFYKFNRDWELVLKYIGVQKPLTCDFPFEIFPEKIRQSIFEVSKERSLNPLFLATAGLWTASSLAGTCYTSDFGTDGKNILFCMIIAPVSVGKTPAFKAMMEQPLKQLQEQEDESHKKNLTDWNAEKTLAYAEKKQFTKSKPKRFVPFAVDGTTEGYIQLCQDQQSGIGVYHDEAETILNAGSFKSNNDSISFFTQAFSGGRFTQIRADRDKERVVKNLNINLLMGTQPSRLRNIFTEDRIANGFASRFLMVESDYLELNEDSDPFTQGRQMCSEWVNLVCTLYDANKTFAETDAAPIRVEITPEAKQLYRKYYKENLKAANVRIAENLEGHIIGTQAKMSTYIPRLTQLIAIMQQPLQPIVNEEVVELGQRLFKFYASSTVNIISKIFVEADTGLPNTLETLFNALPDIFTKKQAEEVCNKLNMGPRKFETSLRRKDFGKLFKKINHGEYQKAL